MTSGDWPRQGLSDSVEFCGVGVHSGKVCRAQVGPAEAGSGCWLECADQRWPASLESVVEVERCTVLGKGDRRVSTVEHLFAALSALHIWDCTIRLEGSEIPILDGSALPFLEALAPLAQPAGSIAPYVLDQPLWVGNESAQVLALPHHECLLNYALHYDHPMIGYQEVCFAPLRQSFAQHLAPARTFALQQEVDWLRAKGLAQGGSLDNALVVQEQGFSSPLRLEFEPVRHKCLDLLGDLYLLGRPLQAKVLAIKAGHRWHVELLRRLQQNAG